MSESVDSPVTPEQVEALLKLPDLAEQIAFLADSGLLTGEALTSLLDYGGRFIGSQPAHTRQICLLFSQPAVQVIDASLAPRALYLQAQSHAVEGELAAARGLILEARDAFGALGQTVDALRTNIGLMNVLGESGEFDEALAAGQLVLDTLDNSATNVPAQTAEMLRGLVQQNRGICLEHLGRYDEAEAAYDQAENSFQKLDMKPQLGHVGNNRGIILLNTGRGSEALTTFQRAANQFEQTGETVWLAQSLINTGDAQLLLGQYEQGLESLRQARQLLENAGALAEQQVLLLDSARAYLALNLFPEALAAFREAADLFAANGMRFYEAQAQAGLGASLVALNHFDDAQSALEAAAHLFRSTGNIPLQAAVHLEQAALLAQLGERGQALQVAQQAADLLADPGAVDQWPVQRFYAHLRLADLLLPDAAAVRSHLEAAQVIGDRLGLPHLRFRVYQRLGHLALLQEDREAAETALLTAVDEIERLRSTLVLETTRVSFLHDKVAVYEDLMQLYLRGGDETSLQRAFVVAEQAKSRALIDLLMGLVVAQPDLAADPAAADRLAKLQADLNAIYNQVLATGQGFDSSSDGGRMVNLSGLRQKATRLEQEISRLRLEVSTLPDPDDYNAFPVSAINTDYMVSNLEFRLPTDQTLLAYHSLGDELLVFIYAHGRLVVRRDLTTIAKIQSLWKRLTMQWDRFRAGSAFIGRNMTLLEQSAQRVLYELYRELIEPLEAYLPPEEGASLLIIPHGPLHHVPFHALHDGQDYLLDRFEISYSPSVTTLTLGRSKRPRPHQRAFVIGVSDPGIPAVAQEVQAVAHSLNTTAWLDESATLARFREAVEGCDVLHLACHGLFRGDNPMFSALKLYDGWLAASDALALNLDGALVTLSACESGRSQVLGGDELLGLSRAFLGAGAATLVASLWLVADKTTAQLMRDFYGRLGNGHSPVKALRLAQLALKEQYSHPYYWGPFFAMGSFLAQQ